MKRTLTASCAALALTVLASAAYGQQGVIPAQPIPQPAQPPLPLAPTSPTQQPEAFGRFLERGTTVAQRPRPELDPLGLRFGNWFLFPRIELDEVYNDNVFAT